MKRSLTTILALTVFLAMGFGATVKGNYLAVDDTFNKPNWHTDYSTAYEVAKEQKKMLFIFFTDAEQIKARKEYESRVLANPKVAAKLRDLVLVRVPLTATAKMNGQEVKLLDHPSFAEMHHRQGIAVVDLASDNQELHGQVVSVFPFPAGRYYSLNRTLTILGLPTGTLTQRTMIFAVRIHPEHPRSTRGLVSRVLMRAARDHSGHQARIRNQGHHNWESRFHRINSQMPGGLLAQEVVAESWPGETLVEAAEDCVDSWRQSSGHWSAVRSDHATYGYDIKKGSNGIWYATGIFGNLR